VGVERIATGAVVQDDDLGALRGVVQDRMQADWLRARLQAAFGTYVDGPGGRRLLEAG